jgi:hypothetical protein
MERKRPAVDTIFDDLLDAMQGFAMAVITMVAAFNAEAETERTPVEDDRAATAREYGKGYDLLVKLRWQKGQSIGKLHTLPYAGPVFDDDGRPRFAHAHYDVTGIGWVDNPVDRYCWPIEFLIEDAPRTPPVGKSLVVFGNWWRQGTASTVEECVSNVANEFSFSKHSLKWLVPESGCVGMPVPGSAPHVQEIQFLSDATLIAKLYRICTFGDALHDQWRLSHAVDACIDASATDYMSKTDGFHYGTHYSFGLVCAGTAYVCIVRPLEFYRSGSCKSTLSARMDVALNHWQPLDMGWSQCAMQTFDFCRASRYAPACLPSSRFMDDYIHYIQSNETTVPACNGPLLLWAYVKMSDVQFVQKNKCEHLPLLR